MEPFNREDYRTLRRMMLDSCEKRGIDNGQLLTWIERDEFGGIEKGLRELFEHVESKGIDPRTKFEDISDYQLILLMTAIVNTSKG